MIQITWVVICPMCPVLQSTRGSSNLFFWDSSLEECYGVPHPKTEVMRKKRKTMPRCIYHSYKTIDIAMGGCASTTNLWTTHGRPIYGRSMLFVREESSHVRLMSDPSMKTVLQTLGRPKGQTYGIPMYGRPRGGPWTPVLQIHARL